MTSQEKLFDRAVSVITNRIIPLLWQGRLSWIRITVAFFYGKRILDFTERWQLDSPARAYHGWFLQLFPDSTIDALIAHADVLSMAVYVLVLLCILGLGSRPALFALAVLGTFVHAVQSSQGVFDHGASLPTQVLIVLAFAPGTNVVSLERLVQWLRAGRPPSWGYLMTPFRRWGELLILALLAITYITSGLSKLRYGGWSWLDGETLGVYLRGLTAGERVYLVGGGPETWRDDFGLEMYTYGNYAFGAYPQFNLPEIVEWIAHTSWLLVLISIATVVLELAGFLLFVPKVRSILLVGYIGMHTTIGLLMGLGFTQYRLICFFLIEWLVLSTLLRRWSESRLRKASAFKPISETRH